MKANSAEFVLSDITSKVTMICKSESQHAKAMSYPFGSRTLRRRQRIVSVNG